MDNNNFNSENLFARILDGNATTQEQEDFEQWISKSKDNKFEFSAYKKIWESTQYLKTYNISVAKIKTQIKILEKLKTRKNFLFYWQKVAAIIVIPILIASAYFYFDKNKTIDNSVVLVETVTTSYGSKSSLELPDGSLVWLNSGSEITFPKDFTESREVELKGEIYLEVKKSKKPFIVKTTYGDVKVLGTKFNVSAYNNMPFTTTLLEGSVVLSKKSSTKEVVLEPGFQSSLQSGKFETQKVDPYLFTSWKDGKLVFSREPFELVAKRLERWFNVKITLEGEPIKKLWYTGTIEMETFSEVLELIKNTTPIDYSFNSKTRVLTIVSKI